MVRVIPREIVFPPLRIERCGEPCTDCGYGLSLLDPPGSRCRFCAAVEAIPDDVCPQCFHQVGESLLPVDAHAADCPFVLALRRWISGED